MDTTELDARYDIYGECWAQDKCQLDNRCPFRFDCATAEDNDEALTVKEERGTLEP
jgi:hypothetical protein